MAGDAADEGSDFEEDLEEVKLLRLDECERLRGESGGASPAVTCVSDL